MIASVYRGETLLSTQSVLLGAINSWSSLTFGIGGIGSLIITGSTAGFSPYGIDNLQFTPTDDLPVVSAIPEPETYALMLAGLGMLGFALRREKRQPTAA